MFLVLVKRFRTVTLLLIRRERWTFVLCLWVLASTVWSVDPGETFRRAIALVGTSMVGLYLGMRYEPRQQLRLIALVVGLGAIASLTVGLFAPGIGLAPDTNDGAWQGIYHLKNALGRMMALGVICSAVIFLGQRRNRAVVAVMFLLSCALLLLSRSATAVVVSFLMMLILPFRRFLYFRIRPLIGVMSAVLVALTAVGLWALDHSDQLFEALGKSASLTGRIPLWEYVWKEITQHPIQGYGFGAFWQSWEGERVSDAVNWEAAVPHSHNGFLEMWLGIGAVGLAIVLIGFARNFRAGLRVAKSSRQIYPSWPLLLLIFTVLYNLTESSLLGINSLLWMIYVANSFWLVRFNEERKLALRQDEELELAYSA